MSDGLPLWGEADWSRLPPGSRPPEPLDPDSAAFIAECADDPDLLAHALVDAGRHWFHCRPLEFHRAAPDLSRRYIQPGTGNLEAPCLMCDEAVVYHPDAQRNPQGEVQPCR